MEVINVSIKDLIHNKKNPRKISSREQKRLMRSIEEFGFVDPAIVNKNKARFNIIIGGHQRVKAAEKLGWKEVPVAYVDLPEDREHLLNVALNSISGEWDDEKLMTLLKELQDRGADVTLSGFAEPLLDEMLARDKILEKEKNIDRAPIVPTKAKAKKGEIWILGNHRVMCGDSTVPADFEKLMAGKVADLCWTDPPYGVKYTGASSEGAKEWDPLKNDELEGEYLQKFLEEIYKNVFKFTREGAAMYTCYASVNHIKFERALNIAGWTVKQQLIWEKGHVLGRSDYHWCHEPILYCRRGDASTEWYGDRTHKTVILNSTIEQLNELKKEELIEIISSIRQNGDIVSEKKDNHSEYLHSTQKPVGLSKRMIKNSTRPGEVVLEPCGGSGSTLMACEVSGRICHCMELDEKYVDVIVERWALFTGKDPVREDGVKWSQLK